MLSIHTAALDCCFTLPRIELSDRGHDTPQDSPHSSFPHQLAHEDTVSEPGYTAHGTASHEDPRAFSKLLFFRETPCWEMPL